jgi:hypothetical protein
MWSSLQAKGTEVKNELNEEKIIAIVKGRQGRLQADRAAS